MNMTHVKHTYGLLLLYTTHTTRILSIYNWYHADAIRIYKF